MDRFPEEKHKDSAECDNVEDLIFGIVGLKHGDVESAEDRDAVDGEMWRWDEETRCGGYDDGDEGCALLLEGDERVDKWEGVCE